MSAQRASLGSAQRDVNAVLHAPQRVRCVIHLMVDAFVPNSHEVWAVLSVYPAHGAGKPVSAVVNATVTILAPLANTVLLLEASANAVRATRVALVTVVPLATSDIPSADAVAVIQQAPLCVPMV